MSFLVIAIVLLGYLSSLLSGKSLVKRSPEESVFESEEDLHWQSRNCWTKLQLFWPPTGSCFPIGARGPCSRTQWIVANVNPWEDIPQAQCQERPCLDEAQSFWLPQNKCYPKISDTPDATDTLDTRPLPRNSTPQFHPCPASLGMRMVDDPQGFGVCECLNDPDVHVYWTLTGRCYPLYQQGPCQPGEFLVYEQDDSGTIIFEEEPEDVQENSKIQCKRNPCSEGKVPFQRNCYPLKSEEPCSIASDILDVNRQTLQLECLTGTRQLGSIASTTNFCRPGSIRDALGKCKVRYNG